MTKYEELLAEYEEEIFIQERPMKNDGLYADGCAWINANKSSSSKRCILAEEVGHYKTTVGDILDQSIFHFFNRVAVLDGNQFVLFHVFVQVAKRTVEFVLQYGVLLNLCDVGLRG